MKELLTIKDIAQQANCSKSTVSRYLNQNGYVSEDVSKRLKAIVESSGYRPSAIARNLSKKKSDAIGVIIPEINNPFFSGILRGITKAADKHNYNIMLFDTDNDYSREKRALLMLEDQRVGGLIIAPTIAYEKTLASFVKLISNLNIPVILIERKMENSIWDGVFRDDYAGVYNAVQLLTNMGETEIAIITNDLHLKLGQERLEGYKNALRDNGIAVNPEYVLEGDFSIDTSYQIAKRILNMRSRPKAVFNCNNYTSMGFFKAVFEENIAIGKDMRYFSMGRVDFLEVIGARYSYVKREEEKMGSKAMELLLERIGNPDMEKKEYIFPANLVINF